MINASKEFKEKLKKGAVVANYADVTLRDGTLLHLEPKDFMIGGCRIEDKTTDGRFGTGFVIGKTVSLRIANHDERFSQYDFYNATIILFVAMAMDDGSIEKIRKGVYYTTLPETPGDIIEINAVDGMHRLDSDYSSSTTTYPATLQSIITGICLDCGIPIGFRQFDNMGFVVQTRPETGTFRQILSYAAQIAGYNARIDNEGYMQLVWYKTSFLDQPMYYGGDFHTYPHDITLYGGNFTDYGAPDVISGVLFTDEMPDHVFRFKDLTVRTDDVVITGVRVKNDETEVLFGDPGYVIKVENNPLTEGKENEVANHLGGRMVGLSFRPFSGMILGNPLYEPFDVCRVSDRKGNTYQSIINSVSYTIGSYTEISCQAEDPIRNESSYASPAAQAVVEARRNTEKKLTEYDKAVQNMNQIAMNAMGFHTTYEEQADGSRITYLHDKPNLADSKTIYKQSIDGFFVSTDGGKSYTAGFDSQGNAVVNVLAAIGIIFDWAKGGTLTLGGSGNVNGAITVLNSSGAQIGKWDKDGISILQGIIRGTLIEAGGLNNSFGIINIYDNNNKLCNQIRSSGMELYNDGVYTGSVGTSEMSESPDMKAIRFGLAHNQAFMCWGYQEEESGLSIIKFAYYSPAQSRHDAGLHLGADLMTNFFRIYIGDGYDGQYITGSTTGISLYALSQIAFRISGSTKASVSYGGMDLYSDLNMHSNSILNESDERLKENIKESEEPALEIINNIQTYSFDWIETGKHEDIDFVAQQIDTVAPNLVKIDEESGVYSINKAGLIPYLVKAVQELTAQVKGLKEEIAELKGQKISPRKSAKVKWAPTDYTNNEKMDFVDNLIKSREVEEAEPIPIVEGE